MTQAGDLPSILNPRKVWRAGMGRNQWAVVHGSLYIKDEFYLKCISSGGGMGERGVQ